MAISHVSYSDGVTIVQASYSVAGYLSTSYVKANEVVKETAFNPLEFRGNYSAISNDMKLVHWPLMGGLLHVHLVQQGGDWTGPQPVQSSP